MRFVLTMLLWLVTTVLLAVAVPAAWAQQHLVDEGGYASFAASSASDAGVQGAVASELTNQVSRVADLSSQTGPDVVRAAAGIYTSSPVFPGQFGQANRLLHRWLFTNSVQADDNGRWMLDLTPMLADGTFQQTLNSYGITAPTTLSVPLTENVPAGLRPGQLQLVGRWGPWASGAVAVLAGLFALLTLTAARSRGKALAALGVSALLVGAAGWAGLEIGKRYLANVLDQTPGGIRQIVDAMVGFATGSLHQWLNLTLIVGGGLVIIGIIVSLLGGLRRPAS